MFNTTFLNHDLTHAAWEGFESYEPNCFKIF